MAIHSKPCAIPAGPALAAGMLAVAVLSIACGARQAANPPVGRSLVIAASEYAFSAPDTVDPGPTTISLRNDGGMDHELIVMKLRAGLTLSELARVRKAGGSARSVVDGGSAVLFAPPGAEGDGRLVIDLEPGARYVLWCDFTDAEGAPEHSTLGMIGQLVVREAPAADGPVSHDLIPSLEIRATDYAFVVPDTLPSGPLDIRLRNVGTVRHELAVDKLVVGADPALFIAGLRRGADVDSFYDSDGAILTAHPGEGSFAAVRVDLEPGRVYVLTCAFKDHETAPRHLDLGMFKAVYVSPGR